MTSLCFYFQVHQPYRLKHYRFDEIGANPFYEDHVKNEQILHKVADKCYLPTNAKMLDLINRFEGRFRISYSISGTALEQFAQYRPEVIDSFKALVATGAVEILAETYYHSLSVLYSPEEFRRQVQMHEDLILKYFGQKPKIFRNTELIYSNAIGQEVADMGYLAQLCEGVDRILTGRSPNKVYKHPTAELKLLLKNYSLSDDIAFRFSDKGWAEHPLTAHKFASWVHRNFDERVINLFMDYETFGEHQWADSGIFEFLDHLPGAILENPNFDFKTPSEVVAAYPVEDVYAPPFPISWADAERDLSAWLDNAMQLEAVSRIYALEQKVKEKGDDDLLKVWGKLQTSDHFYYMSTKFWSDGDVHKYFSPYDSPYDASVFYMNVLSDFEKRIG